MSESEKVGDVDTEPQVVRKDRKWRAFFGAGSDASDPRERGDKEDDSGRPAKWSMGILNDTLTNEVPGISNPPLTLSAEFISLIHL